MVVEKFRQQIKEKLNGLTPKETVFFAWLCGVRALPFLGAAGPFRYWISKEKGDMRLQHLLAVLRALDVAAANANANVAAAAANAAFAAAANAAAANAAFAAAFAADAADAAANAAFAADAAADAANKYSVDLQPLLLQDIEAIRFGHLGIHTALYGPIWQRFQTALANIGCA